MDHAAHQQHHEPPPTAAAHHEGHAAGHDRHAGHSVNMFRDKFWLSLVLTIPAVVLSSEVAGWLGYAIPMMPGIEYVPAILGTIIFFYGGLVFVRGAQGELADRKPGMMTLLESGEHRRISWLLLGARATLLSHETTGCGGGESSDPYRW